MQIGDILPEFKLMGIDDQWHTHFDYADRYALLVYFTNNSCPTAQAYRDRIIKLEKKFEEDNLGIVRINSSKKDNEKESLDAMKKLAETVGMEHLYLRDDEQVLAKKLDAKIFPEVFLFNSRRELVYKGAIDDSWENENMVTMVYLEDAIEYTLDGIEVDYPEIEAQGCKIEF
jgi:peroxiredoxin